MQILPKSQGDHGFPGNHFGADEFELHMTTRTVSPTERAMTGFDAHDSETIDRKTSRSICDAVGERLQQNLAPQSMAPSPELDRLMEEMRRREAESGINSPSQRDRGLLR